MNSEECLKQFTLDHQFRLNLESVERYQCAVQQLLVFTAKNFDAITKRDIRHWLSQLEENGYKPWTVYSKLTGLKTFYRYCLEEGFTSNDPANGIPFPSVGETRPYYLTLEQLTQLRQIMNGRRLDERAIIEVLYATGMRISELCAMKKEDIHWSDRTIVIPRGKRKKGRIVLFTQPCSEHLKRYLESRTEDLPYVFVGRRIKDRPINPDVVGHWFKAYGKQLGFRVTPHTLRHTFAAHLAQKGMPLECIQTLLGHEDPHQTRLYARLFHDARKAMYDEFM